MKIGSLTLFIAFIFLAIPKLSFSGECMPLNLEGGDTDKSKLLAKRVVRTKLCGSESFSRQSVESVWASLMNQKKVGGKRFDTPPPGGSPTGLILPSGKGVDFDFRKLQEEKLESFMLLADGKVIHRLNNFDPEFSIQINTASTSVSYSWALKTSKNNYHGEFHLAEKDVAALVNSRITEIRSSHLDRESALLYEAIVYDDNELYAARDKALHDLADLIGM